jgi:hypothetical protein
VIATCTVLVFHLEGFIDSQVWEEFTMATRRLISSILAMMVLLSTLTVGVASAVEPGVASNPWVSIPWKVETWASNYNASDFSIAFGGANENLLMDFYELGAEEKTFAMPSNYLGNCGPGNRWSCWHVSGWSTRATVSEMATYTFINTFKVGWLYQNPSAPGYIMLHYEEIRDDLQYVTTSPDKLMIDFYFLQDVSDPWTLYNAPSMVYDSVGNPHIVLTIRTNTMHTKLIYAHKMTGGATPTNPCNSEAGNLFQCDLIYSMIPVGSSGQIGLKPKIVLTTDNKPRIGFVRTVDGYNRLMYAYPTSNMILANCGPNENTWHCMTIDSSNASFNIHPWLDMAIGPGAPQFAYQAKDPTNGNRTWIYHAKYVGSDGNCGTVLMLGNLVNTWQCTQVVKVADAIVDPSYVASYSIQVDPNDYPVIAHQYTSSDLSPLRLELSYPSLRIGVEDGSWTHQVIDSGPYDVGQDVGLALNKLGMGCMAYLEDIDYEPTVKLTCQGPRALFLPLVKR